MSAGRPTMPFARSTHQTSVRIGTSLPLFLATVVDARPARAGKDKAWLKVPDASCLRI